MASPRGPTSPPTGRELLAERVVERCEGCRAERARGNDAFCRCAQPDWRPFCTRCVKTVEGELCPNCLAVAEANGAKLRIQLDEVLARYGGLAGIGKAFDAARSRAESTLREFGIGSAVSPLPEWALRLSDKRVPLPPGAEHSRVKMQAVNALRLEAASVELALSRLGYTGQQADDRLAAAIATGSAALAHLSQWDGLAAGAEHEHALRESAAITANAVTNATQLIDSIRRRDLGALVEASVRRQRAVRECETVLGIA
jgi:hypothetical protein